MTGPWKHRRFRLLGLGLAALVLAAGAPAALAQAPPADPSQLWRAYPLTPTDGNQPPALSTGQAATGQAATGQAETPPPPRPETAPAQTPPPQPGSTVTTPTRSAPDEPAPAAPKREASPARSGDDGSSGIWVIAGVALLGLLLAATVVANRSSTASAPGAGGGAVGLGSRRELRRETARAREEERRRRRRKQVVARAAPPEPPPVQTRDEQLEEGDDHADEDDSSTALDALLQRAREVGVAAPREQLPEPPNPQPEPEGRPEPEVDDGAVAGSEVLVSIEEKQDSEAEEAPLEDALSRANGAQDGTGTAPSGAAPRRGRPRTRAFRRQVHFHVNSEEEQLLEAAVAAHGSQQKGLIAALRALAEVDDLRAENAELAAECERLRSLAGPQEESRTR